MSAQGTDSPSAIGEHELGEEQQVTLITEGNIIYHLSTDRVVGGLLMMAVQREPNDAVDGRTIPLAVEDAYFAIHNPHKPVLRVGKGLVIDGLHGTRRRSRVFRTTPVVEIIPHVPAEI